MNRRCAGSAVLALVICVAACGGASPSEATDPSPGNTAAATLAPDPTPVVTPKPTSKPQPSDEAVTPAPEPSGELVAVLAVRCADGAPELDSDRVRASRDGVRLRVTGPEGWHLGVEYESGRESIGLERSDQVIVLRTAPGDVTIDCGDPEQADSPPGASVRIEDPDGWHRSMEIGNVPGSCMSGEALYVEDARGAKESPVEQARKRLKGLRDGDVVQRGGYPADEGLVRIVRDGQVIGALTYIDDGHGGWLPGGSTLCGGLQG